MFKKIEVGIEVFRISMFVSNAIMSTTVIKTIPVYAQSPKDIESIIKNVSKMGVVITSTPVICVT
jgi:hypothetical protein